MMSDDYSFLHGPVDVVAPRLLGCELIRSYEDGGTSRVRIVETEAYDQTDVASHSYKGRTQRTEVMFGEPGKLYVYFTYGMHYCCNVVAGPEGHGAAALIRAVEPVGKIDALTNNRPGKEGYDLTNGPAKLCQALKIDRMMNGHDLKIQPLRLKIMEALPAEEVVTTTRVGISKGVEVPWRFYIRGNPFVSRY